MMNKWTSMTMTLILLGFIGQPLLASPQAGNVKDESSLTINSVPLPSRAELVATYSAAESKLQQVQGKIRLAQYGSAYQEALEILNDVKLKVGINPFAKFREKIHVESILHETDLSRPYSHLSNNKKEQIARAVYAHYNGQYILLLNLMKRARVMYVYAYYEANKANLYERDLEKLKRDLVNAHNIPILVQDKKLSEAYMLFDLDVAEEDIQFSFNKEIMDVAIKVLNQTEQDFEALLQRNQSQKFEEYKKGIQQLVQRDQFRSRYETSYKSFGNNPCIKDYVPGLTKYNADTYNSIECTHKSLLPREYKTVYNLECASGYLDGAQFDRGDNLYDGKWCLKM